MGVTWTPVAQMAENIREVRARTERPFQVNFVLHFEPEGLDAALDEGAPVVTFSWGNPGPLIEKCHAKGAKVGVQVANLSGADYMMALGADFLIFQGVEAGGHVQSHRPLADLLLAAKAAEVGIPYVAAGGLATAEDVRRVLRQGAQGAMLGTRFVATRESAAHESYKQLLIEAAPGQTVMTICFDGGWRDSPHRVLRNATFEAWEAAGCPVPGQRFGEGDVLGHKPGGDEVLRYDVTAPMKGMTGEIEEMCLYAGTAAGTIDDIPAAGDLVKRLFPDP
jgi:nitronate monooxygenase